MLKRIAMAFVSSLPALMCLPTTVYAQAELSVVGPTGSIAAGSSFNVDVDISRAINVYGYQFDVQFDPRAIEAISSSEGSFLAKGGSTFFIPGTNDNLSGTVFATADTLIGAVPGVSGSGELATFTFEALTSGVSLIGVSGVQLIDSGFNIVGSTSTGGSVTITPHMSAPEIHSDGAVSAATFLFASLAVMLSGRRRQSTHGS